MTVKEFIGTLESSDRLRIIEGKAEVYVGYLVAFKPFADHEISEEYRKYSGHEVKKFRAVPEITHRRWKELGLMKPLKERAGSMTKKKPDFLRDLDTAIMDELTGGGIKGNAAGLVGTLTQIKEIKQLCGLPFCGYMAKLETVRPSGVPDEVTVVFAEDVPYRACNGIEFDVMQEFVEGSRLLLTGKVQTLKDFQSGRLLVYILADFVAVSEKAVEQDEAAVRGVIANKPTYRETPRGKRITDITVKVRNELTGGSCFLPCICWQEQADEAAQWQQGDTVELLGRYQSRQYEKVLDAATGEREQRTAYEVSVRLIRRKEEAENEC